MSGGPPPVALCAALGDETRWEILVLVGERDQSASELAERLPVTRQAVAHHLAILAETGLVEASRTGRHVRYRALGQPLTRLAHDLEAIGHGWDRRLERLRTAVEQAP